MIQNNQYQIIGESKNKEEKRTYWEIGIGLQDVDDLKPSRYLMELSEKNIDGGLSYEDVQKEADFSAARIAEFLETSGFRCQPVQLKVIHGFLFQDIYDHAGRFRNYNIQKAEPILNNKSVKYADYRSLEETLEYDFKEEERHNCSVFHTIERK